MGEQLIGTVSHYFGHINVAAFEITDGELRIGDTIHVVGHTTDFTQPVESMQIEHASVETAQAGDNVGVQVSAKAREHDKVYKVVAET